tara:strand:- start:434 stop:754 length:321 start_codon:yes stop_codon:yes gene_type:complete
MSMRVPIGAPFKLLYTALENTDAGLAVTAQVQKEGDASWSAVAMSEDSTPDGHSRVFSGTYTPVHKGWYVATFKTVPAGGEGTQKFYVYDIEGALKITTSSRVKTH